MPNIGINNNAIRISENGTIIPTPLTRAEMLALTPVEGERCYCSTYKKWFEYNGSMWIIRGEVAELTNRSGGALVEGDVVIVDSANNDSCTTTTTASNVNVIGPIVIGGDDDAQVAVAYKGIWDVNMNSSATRGNFIKTTTVVKTAEDFASPSVSVFGQVIESIGAAGLARCLIFSKEMN